MPSTITKEGCFDADVRNAINAVLGASAGASQSFPVTSTGTTTLLPATTVARMVIISVQVTQVFANGSGAQPTFAIGETGSTSKFAATSVFTNAAAGATFSFAGTLSANAALIVTATAGTGTATGALNITVISGTTAT